MYTLSVPLMNHTLERAGRQALYRRLKRAGAQRVFLAVDCYTLDETKLEQRLAQLKDNCAFFQSRGFEVGCWFWTLQLPEENTFTKLTLLDGQVRQGECCPADPAFQTFAAEYVKKLAATGVDLILFDDDFRLTSQDRDLACFCPLHQEMLNQRLGRPVTAQEIQKALEGAENPVRTALQQIKKETLEGFARRMRQALDQVAPQVRLGLCAGMSLWDVDGTDAPTLSRILAGATRPLLRLSAAPYWVSHRLWNHRLQDVIELHRLEHSWCGDDIEIMAEGDTYPRPRFTCPAAYLEAFDLAVRTTESADGILKYMADYVSEDGYETGYFDRHNKNRARYRAINELFAGREATGLRVYEYMHKLPYQTLPPLRESPRNLQKYFFPYAARALAANAIPTTYQGIGCGGICFGENARHLPPEALGSGLILDVGAARLLEELGVDVGLESALGQEPVDEECFPDYSRHVRIAGTAPVLTPKAGAKVTSYYQNGHRTRPGSYLYENRAGQRFLVLGFEAYTARETFWRQYQRPRQIADLLPQLSGQRLSAYCPNSPDLYLIAKKGPKGLSVALFNLCPDAVEAPLIYLDRAYQSLRCVGTRGKLTQDTVRLGRLGAYEFCAFSVE